MTNPIVLVNVSLSVAPTPSKLQKTGALLSQGGTLTSPGTTSLLTQFSDLTPLLAQPLALSGITWSGDVATAVAVEPHGYAIGGTLLITIAGSVAGTIPGGYNGTFLVYVTSTTAFTYALAADPGTISITGTYVAADAAELEAMATTFFSQGSGQAVFVLELGAGNTADGVGFLDAWISANPGVFYSYIVPREWDADPAFLDFVAGFEEPTGKTYFYVTTTLATYANYTPLMKCVKAMIEAPPYGVWPANPLSAISWAAIWGSNTLTALSWTAGIVDATTTTAHGVLPGEFFTISDCVPAAYNGTFLALPGTSGSDLFYALATDPGVETGLGQLNASPGGIVTATTTTNHGVEVGEYFTIAGAVAATIANGYDGTFVALPGTTGSTLVYALEPDPGTASVYGTLVASYYASAGVPPTEFSHASDFQHDLNYNPSTTNKVTPNSFAFLFGVTPFPTKGNAALLTKLQEAFVNVVGTGAEGGISDTILLYGTTMDGNDFTYWYAVDWVQINVDLNVANAIINGSNNPINPLYYNQNGINSLQQVAASTMASGVTFGMVLGNVLQTQLDGPVLDQNFDNGAYNDTTVVNAVPFVPYSIENPSDYKIGRYAGFSIIFTPARGFEQVVFNVQVTDFVAA